ncbi:MAG: Gldg family protein [Chloroflexi bacterium]|nr:Gldg family protein [Chloroflexota bacterium]
MQSKSTLSSNASLIAILGLAAVIVGLVVMLLLPGIKFAAWGVLGIGVALMVLALVVEFRTVRTSLTNRRGRFSAGTTVMASVFVGIIILGNAISVGKYHRFDLTKLSQYTLSPQTKDVLAALKDEVDVVAFFAPTKDPNDMIPYASFLLSKYQEQTDKVKVQAVDPEAFPDMARQYKVDQYQTVVFRANGHDKLVLPQEIQAQAEYAFTSAILQVTGTVQKKVYFLTGHGEGDNGSAAATGFSSAARGLQDDLYQVATLDFINNQTVPDDASVLVIVAPTKALAANESAAILHYLKSGGTAMILADPGSPETINQLIAPWGLSLASDTIIDPASFATPNKNSPTVSRERNAFNLPIMYFPNATAINLPKKADKNVSMLPLVVTTPQSWLEKDASSLKAPVFDPKADTKGPFNLGILVAAAPTEIGVRTLLDPNIATRLAVIGDSDFASNQHYDNGNNSDLFLDTVSWLTEQTQLITVRHNVLPFRRLIVGPEQETFIKYSAVGLLPFLVLLGGVIVWWRRR